MPVPIWNENSKSFKINVKDNPKDRIETILGDDKAPAVIQPQVKICRWDNEVNASFRLQDFKDYTVTTEAEKIKLVNGAKEVHLYERNSIDDITFEDGGFELEVVLKEKPLSNVLEFSLETKGLNFFYQPELTQQEIDEGASRPENVIGSYAVYHATKGGMNDVTGMEYKVGKAFHLYRSKATDANGDWVWCDYNTDLQETGILRTTIPQSFLDSGKYPITVK